MKMPPVALAASLLAVSAAHAAPGRIVRSEHYVRIESAAEAPTPGGAKIYMREVVSSKTRGARRGVVLRNTGAAPMETILLFGPDIVDDAPRLEAASA